MKPQTVLALLAMAVTGAQAQTNVVFVTIDDLSRESLGIHGCPVPEISPHIDSIGYAGLRFEHAHVQAGNCTPSRNLMMSGQYQQHNRVFSLGKEGAGNHFTLPAIPDVFRTAGFHTGIMGKNSHQCPFDPYSGWDVEYDGYGSTKDPLNVYEKTVLAIADAQTLGKPLFYNLNIFDPHTGWYGWSTSDGPVVETGNHPSRIYGPEEVPYPTWFPPISEAEKIGTTKNGTPDTSIMQEVAAYYNTVKRADDSFGKMLQAFEEAGQMDNTIFVVFADHGVQLPNAKTALYDHSSRSPLFVKWPGVTASNTVNDSHIIASVDLLPMFCEMAGQPIPANLDGRSFLPLIKGEEIPDWRSFVYKQQNDRNKMRAIQTTDFLYIFNPWSNGGTAYSSVTTGMYSTKRFSDIVATGTNAVVSAWYNHFIYRTLEELYDVATDPDCMNNLIDDPAHAADLAFMQNLMEQEMATSGDDFILAAFTNRHDPAAITRFFDDFGAYVSEQTSDPNYARSVMFDPHDDWVVLDNTLFEPYGEWGIWQAEGPGVSLNAVMGNDVSGDSCIELSGAATNECRAVTYRALDTSVFTQLKLDIRIAAENLANNASLSFQYNDGTGWHDFQTLTSAQIASDHNLVFELPGGGLPDAMLFGIKANFDTGTLGRIHLDAARFTGWQDWTAQRADDYEGGLGSWIAGGGSITHDSTAKIKGSGSVKLQGNSTLALAAPIDAGGLGILQLDYLFRSENFTANDRLVVEYYTGSAWEGLETNAFDYGELPNFTYAGTVGIKVDEHTLSSDLSVRFRSETSEPTNSIHLDEIQIKSRLHSGLTSLGIPPTAQPDSYSAFVPQAIIASAPGILDNDSGTSGFLSAELLAGVTNGILNFYSDGSFAYGATNGTPGEDSFTYRAFDGVLYSSPATVMLSTLPAGTGKETLLHYTFDTDLSDSSGNGNNGSYAGSGASISSTSRFGAGSLDTAGTGYVTFNSIAFATTNNWSLSLWHNAASTNANALAGQNGALNSTLRYNSDRGADRNYRLRAGHSSDIKTWPATQAPTAIDTSVWHHLVISTTGLGNDLKFYEDGVEIPGWNPVDDTAFNIDTIGEGGRDAVFEGIFNGRIDEVWIMDYALSANEVINLFNYNEATPPITSHSLWAGAHGLVGDDALPYADADGDTAANIWEYGFNLIPGVKDAYKLAAGGTSGLPRGELKPGSNDRLQFEYVRRRNVSDIAYGVQFSDNLMSDWTDAVMPETVTPINDAWERVVVEDSALVPDATNRFGRVIIIQQ